MPTKNRPLLTPSKLGFPFPRPATIDQIEIEHQTNNVGRKAAAKSGNCCSKQKKKKKKWIAVKAKSHHLRLAY
jgi:hypothetical protein